MKPGARSATKKLHVYLEIDASPRAALDILTTIVDKEGWVTPNAQTPREQAEVWLGAFREYLRRDLSDLTAIGRHCFYAFNSSSEEQLQGAAFVELSDSATLQALKEKRSHFSSYMKALQSLTARQLELVGAGILSLLNVESPTVTKYSADRGVDFFGLLKVGSFIFGSEGFSGWHQQMKVWIIGQAKHYVDGTVSTPALRDLIGSVQMLRSPLADRKAYPELIIRTCDSVFQVLLTTGRLSAEVWKEIERHGVIGIDCEMLASFLASRGIGYTGEAFDSSSFVAWLNEFEKVPIVVPIDEDLGDSSLSE